MIKKLTFSALICAQILYANAESTLDSAKISKDFIIAESSTNSTQNLIDSAPSTITAPPQDENLKDENLKDELQSAESIKTAESNGILERYFAKNPAFGDKQNSIRFEFGASVRSKGFENLYQVEAIYSQPNRFFRLHGRLNLEVGGFFGGGYKGGLDLSTLNLAFAGVSEDILLPLFVGELGNLYFGVGIGAYIKSKSEPRIGSNFTFGERAFVGYFYDSFNIEIFIKHFSNGTLSLPNKGFNFFGITAGFVF